MSSASCIEFHFFEGIAIDLFAYYGTAGFGFNGSVISGCEVLRPVFRGNGDLAPLAKFSLDFDCFVTYLLLNDYTAGFLRSAYG